MSDCKDVFTIGTDSDEDGWNLLHKCVGDKCAVVTWDNVNSVKQVMIENNMQGCKIVMIRLHGEEYDIIGEVKDSVMPH